MDIIEIAKECCFSRQVVGDETVLITFRSGGLQQFAQALQPQWLPIETCPSDVSVDVMCRSNLGNTEYFTRVTNAMVLSNGRWLGLSYWHVPTHWMPLPQPPQVTK